MKKTTEKHGDVFVGARSGKGGTVYLNVFSEMEFNLGRA